MKAACQGDEVDLSDTVLTDVFEKGKLPSEQINVSNLDLETSLVPEMVAFLPVSRESLIGAQNNDSMLENVMPVQVLRGCTQVSINIIGIMTY